VRDFRNLLAWQKADDLVVGVYKVTAGFPTDERYGLTSQIRRAAGSIAANIAEGSGRQLLKDFVHFLYLARGSLAEVEYYIHLAQRLDYLTSAQALTLGQLRKEAGGTLQGLINAISRQMESGRTDN